MLAGCTSTVRGTATVAADGPARTSSAATATPPDADLLEATLPQPADVAELPGGWHDGFGEETDDWTGPTLTTCLGGRNTLADRLVVIGGKVLADDHDDK